MGTYITIDGGTTSTRINLVRDMTILDTIKLNIGARASIDERDRYISSIRDAAGDIAVRNNADNIERILASGMITCEFGLCNLPHISIPAGIEELHGTMYEISLPEISDIPFVFVRGVKSDSKDVADFDMMRGEETELMGIADKKYGDCIYVLPGSHSKIIRTDKCGRIVSFATMLSGEMIVSLSQGTILKDAVDLSVEKTDKEYLLKGYDFARKEGINKALFKVRVLKNSFECSRERVYSFFMGIVLCDEILSIAEDNIATVVIGGRKQIKNAMALILRERTNKNIIELDEKTVDNSTSSGIIKIYEYGK